MPLYEYECQQCAVRIEKIQRFSDPPLSTCSACGGELKRLVHAPAVQFKGSGWYVTDYASQKAASDSSEAAAKKPADSSEKDTGTKKGDESKPAAAASKKD